MKTLLCSLAAASLILGGCATCKTSSACATKCCKEKCCSSQCAGKKCCGKKGCCGEQCATKCKTS